jgi:hypothetical protein
MRYRSAQTLSATAQKRPRESGENPLRFGIHAEKGMP